MANMIDYVRNNQKTMQDDEFNEIDGLVLSELAYIHWDVLLDEKEISDETLVEFGYTRGELERLLKHGYNEGIKLNVLIALLKKTSAYWDSLDEEKQRTLLEQVQNSPRYGNIVLGNFEAHNKNEVNSTGTVDTIEQYAVMTFLFENKGNDNPQIFVGFRGTDNTLEGWNEDFLMAYETETSAQRRCVEYLNRVLPLMEGDIRMGGHSKGGNHSNYAFLFCDEKIRSRIIKLYSYDGPGFIVGLTYNGEPAEAKLWEKMYDLLNGTAVAPYDSVIGLLLIENGFIFVDTDEAVGMFSDHDPFSWQINDKEFSVRDQSEISKYLNRLLDQSISMLTYGQRKAFIDTIWSWIYTSKDIENFDDLLNNFDVEMVASLLEFVHNLPDDDKIVFLSAVTEILILAGLNAIPYVPGNSEALDRIKNILQEKKITDLETLGTYIGDAPVEKLMELVAEIISDPKILLCLVEGQIIVALVTILVGVLAVVLGSIISVVHKIIDIVAAVIAVISFVKLVIDFVKDHWDEFVATIENAINLVQEKITDFVENMKTFVNSEVNVLASSLLRVASDAVEAAGYFSDIVAETNQKIRNYMATSLQLVVKCSNPLLYGIARSISGTLQNVVTVDMAKLQEAVNQMVKLADRVEAMDRRLDKLYRTLTINNIEQGEGVFTSLANLYNLSRADIYVDNGYKIRRKANAISSIYSDYSDVEKWLKSTIGGW